jgi:hypothetical protein
MQENRDQWGTRNLNVLSSASFVNKIREKGRANHLCLHAPLNRVEWLSVIVFVFVYARVCVCVCVCVSVCV